MSVYAIIFAVLAIVAAAVAYGFHMQFSALKAKEDARQKEADDARSSNQKAQKDLESAREELSRRRAELAETREKLNDLRSRQFKQKETDRKQRGNLETDLNDQLGEARRDLDEERSRVDVLTREAKGMQDEISRLRETQRRLDEALKAAQTSASRAAAASAPAASAAPQPAAATAAPVAVAPVAKSDDELKNRADMLDRQLREARRKAGEFEEELKKARGKASTMNRQALLTKNELDLFREKLVWSEKRVVELEKLLFDNKIPLPERAVAPQPKAPQIAPGILARESANTGGEGIVAGAADYVPETTTTEAPVGGEPAAPAAAEPAPEGAGEGAAAAPAESGDMKSGPSAVPPVRRPKAAVEARSDTGVTKAE